LINAFLRLNGLLRGSRVADCADRAHRQFHPLSEQQHISIGQRVRCP
jgi:hypothetical protein